MRRPVKTQFAPAGQPDRRANSPPLRFDLRARDAIFLQLADVRLQIITHQVKGSAEEPVPTVNHRPAISAFDRMDSRFRDWQFEDQPAPGRNPRKESPIRPGRKRGPPPDARYAAVCGLPSASACLHCLCPHFGPARRLRKIRLASSRSCDARSR